MKALIACEYSGKVREALKAKGWDAWSCDLLPTDIEGQHYQGNIFDILYEGWDLLIGFPPCTYLSYVGNRWLNIDTYGEKAIQRHKNRFAGFDFFMKLWTAPIKHICLENPRGYVMQFLKPSQIIHPYYFGDEFKKATCLWLKNLPQLIIGKKTDYFMIRLGLKSRNQ